MREQHIKELEEIPRILVSPDEQLENDHRLIMTTSSNVITLALELQIVNQMLSFFYNTIFASSVQHCIDLTNLYPHLISPRFCKSILILPTPFWLCLTFKETYVSRTKLKSINYLFTPSPLTFVHGASVHRDQLILHLLN